MNYTPYPTPDIIVPPEYSSKRSELFRDCIRLGVMLITYRFMNRLTAMLCYLAAYRVLSGHFAGYNASVNGLITDYKDIINSTTFSMLLNSAVTISSLIFTILTGYIVLGFSFNGYLRPSRDGAKKGLWFFPACFLLNIFSSMAVNYFTAAMDSVGVTIPEADFSIKNPSVAAVAFQFAYIALVAPLIEEVVYRGMILGALSKYGEIPAVVFSALCFGLMHGNIPQAVSAFITGLAYASIAVSSGSILPSLIIHSLNNILVSMQELGSTLGIPHIDTIASTLQVLSGMIGVYVFMTRYSYFKHDRRQALPKNGEVTKVIYRNPAVIIYLLILVWAIIEGILKAN